ncbi:DUF2192 domain-containing protein [Thermoproteus tenax]|uniref:DUF2192 domain-containing protein n=1 Tax=Thermoproteus tenax (strain ATCC 35583 / DSM 2078 / JCM 9277 / NBRC 100435 / Kra 1) TaxID=768679 RepID=G4RNN2_THETK|nr:DUF2192 domain-containing protein [Thermoproteus tenax]CCC81176.1 conserved hypothetical protein [Thermoproteus tenax Kra 1]
MEIKRLHRNRVEAALEVLEKALKGEVSNRLSAVEALKEAYARRSVEPLRGLSTESIYDKELATVHLVGVYGAGAISPGDLDDIFYIENKAHEFLQIVKNITEVLTEETKNKIKAVVADIKGKNVEDKVFRALRYVFTGTVLGLFDEPLFIKSLRTAESVYSDMSEKFLRYAAFYTAYKIAELIATDVIRGPNDLKIYKYTLCLQMGYQRCKPSDKLIKEVAVNVYKVDRGRVNKLLTGKEAIPKVS